MLYLKFRRFSRFQSIRTRVLTVIQYRRRKAVWLVGLMIGFTTHFVLAEDRTLTLAHVGDEQGAIGRGATRLAEHLDLISKGALTIDIIPRAALGGIRDNWVQMQVGALDMQVIDLSAISLLNSAEAIQVSLVPFIFRDQDHFRAFAESQLLEDLLKPVQQETGIRYLGIVEDRAPRVISTTKRAVSTQKDLEGMKIRVPPHPMFIDIFKAWGAIPTPLPGSEMFMALQSGLVVGEDNGVINLVNGSNATVIKYFTPINWSRSGVASWISDNSWSSLSEQQQQWLISASNNAAASSKIDYPEALSAAMSVLPTLGIEIIKPDIHSFRRKTSQLFQHYEGRQWPAGLVEKVKGLQ